MFLCRRAFIFVLTGLLFASSQAQTEGPDALIQRVSADVINAVKTDKAAQGGDVQRILTLVDAKVMPHVNGERMTASAMGRYWRQATPEQQKHCRSSSSSCWCAPTQVL